MHSKLLILQATVTLLTVALGKPNTALFSVRMQLNPKLNNTEFHFQKSNGEYYENPYDVAECAPSEVNVTINGIPGAICSPPCEDMECPLDPAVAARPSCALQSSSGAKYCALLCSPDETERGKNDKSFDNQCGDNASCKPLVGLGICTYDSA